MTLDCSASTPENRPVQTPERATPDAAHQEAWRTAVLAVDDLAYKRRLLDDMEAVRAAGDEPLRPAFDALLRESTPAAAPSAQILPFPRAFGADESVDTLRARLHSAESTCTLLEEEMVRLERQTLDAMAETGRLRKALSDIEATGGKDGKKDAGAWWRERVELTRKLADAERARELLTSALMDSEAEIARLTRTLESAARQLNRAG